MATDKLFHLYSIQNTASLLRLLKVDDYNAYQARSLTLKQIEHRPDIVFEHLPGKDKVVWLEFQGYGDEFLYYRMLTGMMLYCQEQNFTGELLPIAVFLEDSHQLTARKIDIHFQQCKRLFFQPETLTLKTTQLNQLEELADIHLIPLYPLCDIDPDQIQQKAPIWAEKIKQSTQLRVSDKKNVLSLLGGFIAHRLKGLNLNEINRILGDFKMEDTQVGKDIFNLGIEKGEEQGFEKGIKKGVKKGMEKGMEKGLELGKQAKAHQVLINLLSYKFGALPDDIASQIQTISDETTLDKLAIQTLDINNLNQFKELLN